MSSPEPVISTSLETLVHTYSSVPYALRTASQRIGDVGQGAERHQRDAPRFSPDGFNHHTNRVSGGRLAAGEG